MVKTYLFIAIGSALLLASCENDGVIPSDNGTNAETFYLSFLYSNLDGAKPEIEIEADRTSEAVKLDLNRDISFDIVGNILIDVFFKNIRVESGTHHYRIESVETEIFRDSLWEKDQDFITRFSPVPELDVVLAMDVTESLEADLPAVKELVRSFINNVKFLAPSAKVGVVAFATSITSIEVNVDPQPVLSFINEMQVGRFTKLYEGMDRGLALLSPFSENALKVLVTFTDGRDNFSDPEFTPKELLRQLNAEDPKNRPPKSYVIGFENGTSIDKGVLDTLAVNGLARYPASLLELGSVLDLYANILSANYQVVYQRNTQVVPSKERVRFVIKAKKIE